MTRRRYRPRNNQNIVILRATAFVLLISIILSVFFYKMRPVVIRYAESLAATIMYNAANDAILEVLADEGISYNKIVNLTRNEEGSVTSLETDIVKINNLKSLISNKILDKLETKEHYDLYIPIGSFLSNTYTSGYGPKIHFKMQATAVTRVNFSHEFKEAGINQVLHLVNVDISVSGSLIVAGYQGSINAKTSAIAAQTVIVGVTPGAFTNVIENKDDMTAGLINDYGAVAGN